MRLIPLEVMETWPAPNYEHPQTRGSSVVILSSILVIAVVLIVILRLYVRVYILRRRSLDDLFAVAALVSEFDGDKHGFNLLMPVCRYLQLD
jgi:hypothetical protein